MTSADDAERRCRDLGIDVLVTPYQDVRDALHLPAVEARDVVNELRRRAGANMGAPATTT